MNLSLRLCRCGNVASGNAGIFDDSRQKTVTTVSFVTVTWFINKFSNTSYVCVK
jgi:predicted transcriptional regulator